MSTNEVPSNGEWNNEIEALCTLLRTELSASETYRTAVHAIERGAGVPALSLRCLYRSHRRFADVLRVLIRELGGSPWESVGAWGVWAAVHERVAALNGRANGPAVLRVLRHGERYSLELARGALHDLEGPRAAWVRGKLVEGIEANLGLIDALQRSSADEPEDVASTSVATQLQGSS